MSDLPVIVIGAGGHAAVLADALLACGATVLGFTDPRPELAGTRLCGLPVLGGDEVLQAHEPQTVRLVNGIGGVRPHPLRRTVQQGLEARGWSFAGVRHPSAIVSPFAALGDTVQLMARCVVQPHARLGAGCIVNTAAVIEHDVDVGEYAHVAPGAIVCGAVRVGRDSHVGAAAVLRQGVSIGPATLVGAGAVVVKNFEGNGLLVGVPARQAVQAT